MNKRIHLSLILCTVCLEWTRLAGTVKGINLKESTVTIQNHDGDLLTIPVDYQVFIVDKHRDPLELKKLALDEQITLIRTPQEKPSDEMPGSPPEPGQRGQ